MRIELETEILHVKEYRLFLETEAVYELGHFYGTMFNPQCTPTNVRIEYNVFLETTFGRHFLESFNSKEEALEYMKNYNQ